MSLKKMNTIIKVAIPLVLIITIALFVLLSTWMSEVTVIRESSTEFMTLGNQVQQNSDQLIKLMREKFITLDNEVLREYESLISNPDFLDNKIDEMAKFDMTDTEQRRMNAVIDFLDQLAAMEERAVDAFRNGNLSEASAIIQGSEYNNADADFSAELKLLLDEVGNRTSTEAGTLTARGTIGLIIIGIFFMFSLAAFTLVVNWFSKKAYWYDNILDQLPFPISITDMDLKTEFINKPVEEMLGLKRQNVIGKPCSEVWKAGICNTSNCGVECLKRGLPSTVFNQANMDFKVDTAYLSDRKGRKIGHIETVQDITTMLKQQKQEAELVKNIEHVCESFSAASKQISEGSQVLAQGSTEQSISITELSTSISDIAQKTKDNAEMAGRAANLASTIMQSAEKGSKQMDDMTSAVREINQASQSISKVIKVIDDIAFQTNILALNAAVEAARAGQHGKGFAVVAEEVRNLAGKSAEAAKDTGGLIANSMEKAELGARIAEETAASLTEIVTGINESNRLISEIANASDEQSQGIGTINRGIDNVAQGITQTNATAQENASASQEMNNQLNILESALSEFKAATFGTDTQKLLK